MVPHLQAAAYVKLQAPTVIQTSRDATTMTRAPDVSVCIANYNGMAVIDDCLAAVQRQLGDLDIEIIVHDDASDDRSAEHIRTHYPTVQLIESPSNVGFCISNNRMADAASGAFLLLLNNDAILYDDALTTLHTAALEIEQPAILSLPQYDADDGAFIDNGSLLDPFLNAIPNQSLSRREVGTVMGACLWIPRATWRELGGFPVWFESIAEDLYLCCRARLAGQRVVALGQSGFLHHVGASFGGGKPRQGRLSTTIKRRALSERNKTFVMLSCMPWPMLALILPLHFMLLNLEGITLVLLKRDPALWRRIYGPVWSAAWSERQKLRSMRREIQDRRRIGLSTWLRVFHWLPWKVTLLFTHGLPTVR